MIEGMKEAKRLDDTRQMAERKKKELLRVRKKQKVEENGRREEIMKVAKEKFRRARKIF